MHETPGSQRSFEELEATLLGTLDLYFEARLRQVARAPRAVGPTVEVFEEARRRLAEAEEELEALHRRTQEIKASPVDAAAGDSEEGSELGKQVSSLQEEVQALAEAEKAAHGRKEAAKETLRRAELDFGEGLALAAGEVATIALGKVEEIDAFKARVDRRFAEGRTSVLGAAN
jgi:DNA repair exonuclease SbcCD ATPase subunit